MVASCKDSDHVVNYRKLCNATQNNTDIRKFITKFFFQNFINIFLPKKVRENGASRFTGYYREFKGFKTFPLHVFHFEGLQNKKTTT